MPEEYKRIEWDAVGERRYETGVDRGVLYTMNNDETYGEGVPWNGLVNVSENPSGAENNPQYADNIKYLNLQSAEEYSSTIEAFTYPNEFAECDGSKEIVSGVYVGQQPRKRFGLCYRTTIGNDAEGVLYGYKLHLVYNCLANPSEKAYGTINDSPEAITFSWEVVADSVSLDLEGYKPVAQIIIDSTKFKDVADKAKLKALEDMLYGVTTTTGESAVEGSAATLPDPMTVFETLGYTPAQG